MKKKKQEPLTDVIVDREKFDATMKKIMQAKPLPMKELIARNKAKRKDKKK